MSSGLFGLIGGWLCAGSAYFLTKHLEPGASIMLIAVAGFIGTLVTMRLLK